MLFKHRLMVKSLQKYRVTSAEKEQKWKVELILYFKVFALILFVVGFTLLECVVSTISNKNGS